MRIAVIWSRFGPYHVARLRGAAAVAARHGVEVFGIEVARTDAVYAWDAVEKSEGFEHITLFDRETYHDIAPREIRARAAETLSRLAPDAVAINGWAVPEARAAIAWCADKRRAAAIVMSETKADDAPRQWWKEMIKRRMLNTCSAGIVGGRPQADYLAGLGIPREHIHFGYDVVDNDYFRRGVAAVQANAKRLRASLGLPDRYFFACSRFIQRKNIDGLLQAYASYRKSMTGEPWGLVIAGSGEEMARYQALQRELNVDGVVWPGFVQYHALPTYYGLASAFVHPAHAEAWGLVVNEALASGLPVLVSRTVGSRYELVSEGLNGFSFEPSQPDQLADCMLTMSRLGPGAYSAMQADARTTAAQWTPLRFGAALLAAATQQRCR